MCVMESVLWENTAIIVYSTKNVWNFSFAIEYVNAGTEEAEYLYVYKCEITQTKATIECLINVLKYDKWKIVRITIQPNINISTKTGLCLFKEI